MKVAIYRILIEDYDYLINDPYINKNYDYFLFTNLKNNDLKHYKKILIKDKNLSSSLLNRKFKICIPEILLKYDLVIYLDNNIKICASLNKIINKFYYSNCEIGYCIHPYGHNMEQEINACLKFKKAKIEVINDELNYFSKKNIVPKTPLTDNSFLIRRNKSFLKKDYADEWFKVVRNFSGRDQISMPFIREKYNLNEMIFNFSPRKFNNKLFSVIPHKFKYAKKNNTKLHKYIISFVLRYLFMKYLYLRYKILEIYEDMSKR